MAKGGTERGGRTDTRQRRALQRLGQDPFDLLGIEAGDGIVLNGATSKISVVLATDPGLAFSSNKLIVVVGAGLELTSSGIEIDLATNPGLEFSSGDIKAKVGAGLELTSSGIEIDLAANPGLAFSSGDLIVVVGAGLELSASGIEIDLAADPGLEFSTSDLKAKVGDGMELTSSGIVIDLATNPGLAFSSGDLIAKVGDGMELTSSGIEIDLATDPGLEFSTGDLRVKIKTAGGITRDSDGLSATGGGGGSSGIYTPTITNVNNVTSSSPSEGRWSQQGDIVTVAFRVSITLTTSGLTTDIFISLPVALSGNFGGFFEATGSGVAFSPPNDGVVGAITSQISTLTARLRYKPSAANGTAHDFYIMFMYNIDQS